LEVVDKRICRGWGYRFGFLVNGMCWIGIGFVRWMYVIAFFVFSMLEFFRPWLEYEVLSMY